MTRAPVFAAFAFQQLALELSGHYLLGFELLRALYEARSA